MFARAATALGVSMFEIVQMNYYAQELRGGAFATGAPTDHVEQVTGQPPEGFESIARRYISAPGLIAPGLSARSKPGAFAFMVKMMLTRVPDLDRWERERGHPLLTDPVLAQDSAEWRTTAEQRLLNLLPLSNKYGDQSKEAGKQ